VVFPRQTPGLFLEEEEGFFLNASWVLRHVQQAQQCPDS
jgi:hypothetical protein